MILASRHGRPSVVSALLEAGVSALPRDVFDRRALFYASRLGDVESVSRLVAAGSPPNDGSLHEAARGLHPAAVEALLGGGHGASRPSPHAREHAGRNALQELAAACDLAACAVADHDLAPGERLGATLAALMRGAREDDGGLRLLDPVQGETPPPPRRSVVDNLRLLDWVGGKNALFLALDNPHSPVEVTRALLDAVFWQVLDDPRNHYAEEGGIDDSAPPPRLVYSPTTYVQQGLCQSPPQHRAGLAEALRDRRCSGVPNDTSANWDAGMLARQQTSAAARAAQGEIRRAAEARTEAAEQARRDARDATEAHGAMVAKRRGELEMRMKRGTAAEQESSRRKRMEQMRAEHLALTRTLLEDHFGADGPVDIERLLKGF